MKKLLSLVLVLSFVFAGTAIAAEKFTLTGQYRAEFYSTDNGNDWSDAAEDAEAYVDQRFRLQLDLMPADGVKAILRGDFAEANWGTNTTATAYSGTRGIGYRPNNGEAYNDTIMIDKAYVDLQTAMVNWKVGLFGHGGFGMGTTTDNQGANIMITADFAPVAVTALWTKVEEGTSVQDDSTPTTAAAEDRDIYGIQVAYKADAFYAGAFYAMDDDKNTGLQDDTKTVMGLYGGASMGMFAFWAEYDIYGGENENTSMDYTGNVLTIDVVANITEQLKITGDLIWSAGSDDPTTETVITGGLTDDAAYNPMDIGWNNAIGEYWGANHDGAAFVENNCGAKTIIVKVDFAITDALSVYGGYGWSTPDVEDPNDDLNYVDNFSVLAVGGSYTFLPGTSFKLGYESASRSTTGTLYTDDSVTKLMGGLFVNF